MLPYIVAAGITAIFLIVLTIVLFPKFQGKTPNAGRPRAVAQRDGGPGRVQAVRNQRARMRANAARHQAPLIEEEPNAGEEAEDGIPEAEKVEFDDKMGAKKRAKLEAKMEKKKAREAEEQMREMRKKREEDLEEERKKEDEKREQEEQKIEEAAKQAEEERKKREEDLEEERKKEDEKREQEEQKIEEAAKQAEEERKKREQEEYEAMKAAFTVEGEGYEEGEQDQENVLKEFIDYIKTQKVVLLEDLASNFRMKTQAAIDRISDLQTSGELPGVIDDRGKFIYISQKELEDVAKFIKQRGRVSITELAESSNDLINLNPFSVK